MNDELIVKTLLALRQKGGEQAEAGIAALIKVLAKRDAARYQKRQVLSRRRLLVEADRRHRS